MPSIQNLKNENWCTIDRLAAYLMLRVRGLTGTPNVDMLASARNNIIGEYYSSGLAASVILRVGCESSQGPTDIQADVSHHSTTRHAYIRSQSTNT